MDINKLLNFAKSIKDFRLDRKKLHPAENIVFITVLVLLYNATDWEDIADFGKSRKEYLTKHLDLKIGIPSHDIFNQFFYPAPQSLPTLSQCFSPHNYYISIIRSSSLHSQMDYLLPKIEFIFCICVKVKLQNLLC
ncbi:MAG: transposase family protein [Bacteroidetes bacterium]|jgi:hypothetical protein|nr:transposase family protein [Bacteroidota bacterium]